MPKRFARGYDRLTPILVILFTLVLFSGSASADTFVFDATINPMTGQYIPQGVGHYNYPGAAESFIPLGHYPGMNDGAFLFVQGVVPVNPASPLQCDQLGGTSSCINQAQFFLPNNGPLLGTNMSLRPEPTEAWVTISDVIGDLLAFIDLTCTEDAICEMEFTSGIAGRPIDLTTLPNATRSEVINAPRIVAIGGLQDAVDAHFYDGSVDSFEFVLSTPEPSSLPLLAALLVGFAVRRRFHSSVKPGGSRS
jgi:hypothetical protein